VLGSWGLWQKVSGFGTYGLVGLISEERGQRELEAGEDRTAFEDAFFGDDLACRSRLKDVSRAFQRINDPDGSHAGAEIIGDLEHDF
jgi:hypothetical protein